MPAVERIHDEEALAQAVDASEHRPVLLFKHSLSCPISATAHAEFIAFVQDHTERALYGLIEIQNARPISNAVAERTGVRHESPQALLLKSGAVVWHASHGAITAASLGQALDQAS